MDNDDLNELARQVDEVQNDMLTAEYQNILRENNIIGMIVTEKGDYISVPLLADMMTQALNSVTSDESEDFYRGMNRALWYVKQTILIAEGVATSDSV